MTKQRVRNTEGLRTLHQVITEDGVMSTGRIFRIMRRLCHEIAREDERRYFSLCLTPHNIFLEEGDEVRIGEALPPSLCAAYLPYEQGAESGMKTVHNVYALGMLMLFMASGDVKKSYLDTMAGQSELKRLIERCTSVSRAKRFRNVGEVSSYLGRNNPLLKKSILVLFVLACFSLLTLISLHFYLKGKVQGQNTGKSSGYQSGYADGYDKGYQDASNIGLTETPFDPLYGNLTANINIGGGAFAVRSEDAVFFLLEGSIYSMDPYTGATKLLLGDVGARNINYYKGRLYYDAEGGIFSYDIKKNKEEPFCKDRRGLLYIIEGEFYLDDVEEGGYLYKLDPVTGSPRQLNDITHMHCLNVVDRRLFFSDPERDFKLYSCDLDGGNLKLVSSNSCMWLSVYDDRIYAYAGNENGSLLGLNLDGGGIRTYTGTPGRYVNVTGSGLFYVSGEARTLEWLSRDGSMSYRIVPTRTGAFNIAGRWIFYFNEEDGGSLWRVRMDGSDNEPSVIWTDER